MFDYNEYAKAKREFDDLVEQEVINIQLERLEENDPSKVVTIDFSDIDF